MILAVDAGNTRVKWALHDGRAFVSDGWVTHAQFDKLDEQWAAIATPSSIVIGNVAGEVVAQKLREAAARWQAGLLWASSSRKQAGVVSRYDDPSQLGVDRWAALIGARSMDVGASVVVNAGTATTIDALDGQGEFLGGIIVSGFDLMHEALAANTARLSAERGQFSAFPRSTRDAITSGAIQALCGAVDRMRGAMLGAGNPEPTLVFTGGAGETVARHMGRPVRFVDQLVLAGLVQIAMESR